MFVFYGLLSRLAREPFSGQRVVVYPHNSCMLDILVTTKGRFMPDADQRDLAEALFEPKQSRKEIKDAIKLEEGRRAAMVKKPIPSEELAPVAQPSQHAVKK